MFLLSIVQNLFSGNRGTPYTGLYGGMGGGAWVGGGGGGGRAAPAERMPLL